MRELAERRIALASACRVLAGRQISDGYLGHVSTRLADGTLLIRARGPSERGLAHSTPKDILRIDGAGEPVDSAIDYSLPHELPIHLETLRLRPEIRAVVHAHPRSLVVADLAGIELLPIVGAYDIPGTRLVANGVPVYPRGVLIRTNELAGEMLDAMGKHPAVILRGHGATSVAETVEAAVLQLIRLESLAQMSLELVAAGATLTSLPAEDLNDLPELGNVLDIETAWRHELARLPDEIQGW